VIVALGYGCQRLRFLRFRAARLSCATVRRLLDRLAKSIGPALK
jgi:hypothetical protein